MINKNQNTEKQQPADESLVDGLVRNDGEQTEHGLIEKSFGRKIESPLDKESF